MRIVHAQTIIEFEKLELLKKLTGHHAVKDALYTAIDEYIINHYKGPNYLIPGCPV